MVPLPRSDPIPPEHEETAAAWVYVFGKELIACLFSRDWAVRETGLRRLAHEVRFFYSNLSMKGLYSSALFYHRL